MKTILTITSILLLAYIVMVFTSKPLFYYGHHFSFENELGIEIDSLAINVGGIETTITSKIDNLQFFEGNIDVPETGYPHKVLVTIYSDDEILVMKADSFNCYNCDGNHHYTLKKSGARYRFSP